MRDEDPVKNYDFINLVIFSVILMGAVKVAMFGAVFIVEGFIPKDALSERNRNFITLLIGICLFLIEAYLVLMLVGFLLT